jgi:putative Mg2+ transporter-C (MgtC) family protein
MNSWLTLLIRLSLALLAGSVIGWNRQSEGKPAGLRTHALVALGAALFVLIPLSVGSAPDVNALSRTIQGVATGIGFLGAGEIVYHGAPLKEQKVVTGLTSAAAIWTCAALGMAAGCGLWQLCLLGTALSWLILFVGKRLEAKIWKG